MIECTVSLQVPNLRDRSQYHVWDVPDQETAWAMAEAFSRLVAGGAARERAAEHTEFTSRHQRVVLVGEVLEGGRVTRRLELTGWGLPEPVLAATEIAMKHAMKGFEQYRRKAPQ